MSWIVRSAKHLSLLSLAVLVLQNTSLVLLLRHSLTTEETARPKYFSSTAIALMEVVKLSICFVVVYMHQAVRIVESDAIGYAIQKSEPEFGRRCLRLYMMNRGTPPMWMPPHFDQETGGSKTFVRRIVVEVANEPKEVAQLMVPALLYTVQNNLLFVGLRNLDAATYSVCYQTKIITTALFSVVLLKKRLTSWKWAALFLLGIGVVLAQSSEYSASDHVAKESGDTRQQSRLLGFMCVLAASCTSGFSGVYFEMLLKSTRTSLWIRNIQMGISSIAMSILTVVVKDWSNVRKYGFFNGYDSVVVGVILLQALGGLVVAVVVKYADNIRKSFATAVSIITSCVLSMLLFDFHPNRTFVLGVVCVCGSIFMYSRPAPEKGLPILNEQLATLGFSSKRERRRSVALRI